MCIGCVRIIIKPLEIVVVTIVVAVIIIIFVGFTKYKIVFTQQFCANVVNFVKGFSFHGDR